MHAVLSQRRPAFPVSLPARMPLLLLIATAVALSIGSESRSFAAARPRTPNFIIILADDLGYGDLGCYGNTVNRTKHLDRLAREGLRLTDFHANGANCSPTRAALLTGRYQQRTGIEGALGEGARGLLPAELTIAERLRPAGYASALIGKWHLGYHAENGPLAQGFDRFVGHLHGATDYISHVDKYGRMDWWHDAKPVAEEGYNTTLITRHAIAFMEHHQHDPFFLLVSHSAIHFPWMLPEDEPQRIAGERSDDAGGKIGPHLGEPMQPIVQRMIEELDRSVGQIVDALERLRLQENTFLFFTSDNGGIVRQPGLPVSSENRISSNAPFRGQKHSLYEGGHRVPAIAWQPGSIAPGVSSIPAITMDLCPTLLELAGLPLTQSDTAQPLDGVSLKEHLQKGTALPERTLYWRQGDSAAVRQGDWKLVRIHGGPCELYDLRQDPAETSNLAASQSFLVRRLTADYQAWEKSVVPPAGQR
ncbi:sulfatase-like hydrolase/transferase [Lignipirellula cremea]|uniref:Arylsulfatase n=1 Tax=Lignipirellula cremea TaxID=2528010 RepID=A0A518DVL4_9BACT|nr:sulfatase-like hydrolase/transferase [Lignipirellula cremea]QDU95876.1 Arylsulfatase [Lignipirellula cremea]